MSGKLLKNIKPNFCFEDERGSLVQLVREGYKQFNVIFSKKVLNVVIIFISIIQRLFMLLKVMCRLELKKMMIVRLKNIRTEICFA